ncbi:MAG: kynureninase [Phycisphaerales bacterium]
MSTQVDMSEAYALELDRADPLRGKGCREWFSIPRVRDVVEGFSGSGGDEPCVYMCGNSLGLMPKATPAALQEELEAWGRLGVEGHFHAKHPWFPAHEFVREAAARLVGGLPHEVVVMNSLTVNLHLMMASFYRPTKERFKIVIEDTAFPSDSYAVQSQAALHGFDPKVAVVRLKPRAGEETLRTEDVLAEIERHGSSVAMVMLGAVNYYTGQWMDMPTITRAAQKVGAIAGWDLAHAAGNVPMSLHEWGVDFACWCSYKYLNSGPGAIAGCFVHERHARNTAGFGETGFLPRLAGWWGNDPKTRFKMGPEFMPSNTADAWSLSNPPIMALTPVRVSLEIFDKVGMAALRAKSEKMAGYLRSLVEQVARDAKAPSSAAAKPAAPSPSEQGEGGAVKFITPREMASRGCQLSIAVRVGEPRALHRAPSAAGVVSDFREPDVVRVAPVPLYNSYHDCWRFATILQKAMGTLGGGR